MNEQITDAMLSDWIKEVKADCAKYGDTAHPETIARYVADKALKFAHTRYAGSGEAVGKAYVDLHGNITVSWFGEIKNGSLLYDCQLAQPKVPDDLTGNQWSVMRDVIQKFVDTISSENNYEMRSAYLDEAPKAVYAAMLSAQENN